MTGRTSSDAARPARRVGLAVPTVLASLLCGGSVLALSAFGVTALGTAPLRPPDPTSGVALGLPRLQPPVGVPAPVSPGPGRPSPLPPAAPGPDPAPDPAPARTAAPAVQIVFTRTPVSARYQRPTAVPRQAHPTTPPLAAVPAPQRPATTAATVPSDPAPTGPVDADRPADPAPQEVGDGDGSVLVAAERETAIEAPGQPDGGDPEAAAHRHCSRQQRDGPGPADGQAAAPDHPGD